MKKYIKPIIESIDLEKENALLHTSALRLSKEALGEDEEWD